MGHEDAQAQVMGFYSGVKESERQVVERYFKSQSAASLKGQRFSLAALHTTPTLLSLLNGGEAGYVVGLKANQLALLTQAEGLVNSPTAFESRQLEKGHGRVDVRAYAAYRLNPLWLEERWEGTGIQTVIWVNRERWRQKDGCFTQERVCFVSNLSLTESTYWECLGAIRNHWQIESDRTGGPALYTRHDSRRRCHSL